MKGVVVRRTRARAAPAFESTNPAHAGWSHCTRGGNNHRRESLAAISSAVSPSPRPPLAAPPNPTYHAPRRLSSASAIGVSPHISVAGRRRCTATARLCQAVEYGHDSGESGRERARARARANACGRRTRALTFGRLSELAPTPRAHTHARALSEFRVARLTTPRVTPPYSAKGTGRALGEGGSPSRAPSASPSSLPLVVTAV